MKPLKGAQVLLITETAELSLDSPPISSPTVRVFLLLLLALLTGCRATQKTQTLTAPIALPTPTTTPAPSPPPATPQPTWHSLALSPQRRPLLTTESGSGPFRIYLIGGIHGDETEGRSALEALKDQFASSTTISLRILRDLNPDGTAAHRRTNSRGRDLNRNWPASNFTKSSSRGQSPLSEPETKAAHADILAFDPHLVIVLHSISSGPFVNFDGPAADFADRFARAAKQSDPRWTIKPEMGYATPGSLGSYLGIDRRIPILTIEFDRGQDESTARTALIAGINALTAAK